MRARIVESLNGSFGGDLFTWLVPDPAFLYALAIGVLLWVFVTRAKSEELSRYHALGAAIWGTIGGLLGARIFFLLQNVSFLIAKPSIVFELNGSTVSWGAYIGGVIGFALYLRRNHQPLLRYADVLASCLGLGPFIARWACFLNGDDYGTRSNVAWAVSFPHGSYPFAEQANAGFIDPMTNLSLPVHPVQLYLSLKGLLLFVICTYIFRRYRLPQGSLFCLYWLLFACMRFFLEFFRGDVSRGFVGPLSVGQVMSIAIFVVSALASVFLIVFNGSASFVKRSIVVFDSDGKVAEKEEIKKGQERD